MSHFMQYCLPPNDGPAQPADEKKTLSLFEKQSVGMGYSHIHLHFLGPEGELTSPVVEKTKPGVTQESP